MLGVVMNLNINSAAVMQSCTLPGIFIRFYPLKSTIRLVLMSYGLDSTSATYLFDKMHSADVRIQEKILTISSCYPLVRHLFLVLLVQHGPDNNNFELHAHNQSQLT